MNTEPLKRALESMVLLGVFMLMAVMLVRGCGLTKTEAFLVVLLWDRAMTAIREFSAKP